MRPSSIGRTYNWNLTKISIAICDHGFDENDWECLVLIFRKPVGDRNTEITRDSILQTSNKLIVLLDCEKMTYSIAWSNVERIKICFPPTNISCNLGGQKFCECRRSGEYFCWYTSRPVVLPLLPRGEFHGSNVRSIDDFARLSVGRVSVYQSPQRIESATAC